MAQTNYYIGKTTNSAGESEINLRLYGVAGKGR